MTDSPVKRRRIGRMLCIYLGLVAVLPLVAYFVWSGLSYRRIQAELARIRAAGEPANAAELETFYRLPQGAVETTGLWLSGAGPLDTPAFNAAAKGLPIVGESQGQIPLPGEPWGDLTAAEKLLQDYAPQLAQLHEAARLGGQARYPTDFEAGIGMLLPHVQQLRSAARLLALEAHVRAHRGDAAGAADSLDAIFKLSGSLEREPLLISQRVRMAIATVGRQEMLKLLPAARFSDEDLARLQADLHTARNSQGTQHGMLGERVLGMEAFNDPNTAAVIGVPRLAHFGRHQDLVNYLEMMGRFVEASKQTPQQAQKSAIEIESELKAIVGGSVLTKVNYILTALVVPAVSKVIEADLRNIAQNDAAGAVLAAERFRRQYGRLPDKLEQLTPEYLPRIPLDPYNGQPLRFQVAGNELVIYSVGADLQDHGGQGDNSGKPDIVVRVSLP
jgi:hypothetical protein